MCMDIGRAHLVLTRCARMRPHVKPRFLCLCLCAQLYETQSINGFHAQNETWSQFERAVVSLAQAEARLVEVGPWHMAGRLCSLQQALVPGTHHRHHAHLPLAQMAKARLEATEEAEASLFTENRAAANRRMAEAETATTAAQVRRLGLCVGGDRGQRRTHAHCLRHWA